MKVELKQVEKKFEPIELVITIESEEERLAIIQVCAFNESIPSMVEPENKEFAKEFLNLLRNNLSRV
jgi:hypothetical protein